MTIFISGGAKNGTSGSTTEIVGGYMASTVTLNPVFDGYWIAYSAHNGGNTISIGTDADNGNIPFADIDRKGTNGDCYVSLMGSTSHKAYTTTSSTKYLAIMQS